MTPNADVAGLLRALDEAGIAYVVIGGIAVVMHGHLRTTLDLDIVPDPDPANLLALGNLLASIDARAVSHPERAWGAWGHDALGQCANLSLTTTLSDLDIVQRLPGTPSYADLRARSVPAEPFGHVIHVAGVDDLTAMKAARASAQDLADIEALQALRRKDP